MARLNAKWNNFWQRGQKWDHFWQDTGARVMYVTVQTYAETGISLIALKRAYSLIAELNTYSEIGNNLNDFIWNRILQTQSIIYEILGISASLKKHHPAVSASPNYLVTKELDRITGSDTMPRDSDEGYIGRDIQYLDINRLSKYSHVSRMA